MVALKLGPCHIFAYLNFFLILNLCLLRLLAVRIVVKTDYLILRAHINHQTTVTRCFDLNFALLFVSDLQFLTRIIGFEIVDVSSLRAELVLTSALLGALVGIPGISIESDLATKLVSAFT